MASFAWMSAFWVLSTVPARVTYISDCVVRTLCLTGTCLLLASIEPCFVPATAPPVAKWITKKVWRHPCLTQWNWIPGIPLIAVTPTIRAARCVSRLLVGYVGVPGCGKGLEMGMVLVCNSTVWDPPIVQLILSWGWSWIFSGLCVQDLPSDRGLSVKTYSWLVVGSQSHYTTRSYDRQTPRGTCW